MRRIVITFIILIACSRIVAADPSNPAANQFHPQRGKGSMNAQQAEQYIANEGVNSLVNKLQASNMPDWLKRIDISVTVTKGLKPLYSLETIQPLYMNKNSTYFVQGRVGHDTNNTTYNLGFGYRYLLDNKDWMWGLNSFYDRTQKYQHQRLGFGAELFNKYATLRGNYYDAISKKKLVSTDVNGLGTYQKALSGYDYSVETPLPYLPWVSLILQAYTWYGDHSDNIYGKGVSLRMHPYSSLELEAGYTDDSVNEKITYLTVSVYPGTPKSFGKPDFWYRHGFAGRNLEDLRLEKVRRQNNIVVETTTQGDSRGIAIGRGSN